MEQVDEIEIAQAWLAPSAVVDCGDRQVRQQAQALAQGAAERVEVAQRCFLFVRDAIAHSFDIGSGQVTCRASEVLRHGHGICYAQSHLLAALLRANGIPAGFSYQRLCDDEGGYCLHGFNTLYLPQHGWYRVDARGNTNGIDAQFCPPQERLAFAAAARGEVDYGLNLAEPLPCVVRALQEAGDAEALRLRLPSAIRMG
jgi:transglutaminase-like putative cysteine protease